jgi:Uroporphyrinogen decarboxylase (URO-D)
LNYIDNVTDNKFLNFYRSRSGTHIRKLVRSLIDLLGVNLDKILFNDIQGARLAFHGKMRANNYRSAFGGFILHILSKYVSDWNNRQLTKTRVPPVVRRSRPMKWTYSGFKKLIDEVQPGWEILPDPKKPKDFVKIFENDTMSPFDRMKNIIDGKPTDRVSFGPMFDYIIPYQGKSNTWKFAYDGIETGWASLNAWIHTGGSDFLPFSFGTSFYSYPFPEGHSRFFYKWNYPADNELPQFLEEELLKNYDDLYNYGMTGLTQEITKRMMRDFFVLAREILYMAKVNEYYFGPYTKQFMPYSQLMFYVWDILPFWRGLIPFAKDLRRKPEMIIEAFEFLNKPLTDMMIKIGKITKAKTALFGNSRGSNSWISPKKFEETFWPSMKYSFDQCFKNDILPVCHLDNDWTENMAFFADNLPKRSCLFHLDQVDLVEVHEKIDGKFALMGGMNPGVLVFGSPDKIEQETKRYIENIGTDGLIVASGCEYPCDIPVQNIFAQKRAIKKYGFF